MILTPLVIWNHLTKKKNNYFGGQIPHQWTLSLSKSKSNDLPSLLQQKKRVKMSKIKFGIKIEFCKIQENGYLIAKINKGLKWIFDRNFQFHLCYSPFHFSYLSFNSIIPYKKNMQLGSNLVLKGLNYATKIFEDEIKDFQKLIFICLSLEKLFS